MFENKTLLITGGTGSFGNAVLDRFLTTDIKENLVSVSQPIELNPKYSKALELKNKLIPQETNDDLSRTADILSKQKNITDLAILDVPKSDKYKVENTSEYYNKQGKQFYLKEEYDLVDHREDPAYGSWNELYEEYYAEAEKARAEVKVKIEEEK